MHRENLDGYAFWHIRFCCLYCHIAAGVYVMAGLYFSLFHGCRFNLPAGTYSLVHRILVCGLYAGLTCAARAAAGHFLLPIVIKVRINTESFLFLKIT